MGKFVHKDSIARVGSKYLGQDTTDWQVRHISTQDGFYILNKGDIIPGTSSICPSGYHSLICLDATSPRFNAVKRTELLSEPDFEILKGKCGCRCQHCNSKEGENNYRDGTITKLQRGHIDSEKSAEMGNMIPLCDYCNRTYKDTFVFLPNGAIDKVNLKSQRITQIMLRKMIEIHGRDQISQWSLMDAQ